MKNENHDINNRLDVLINKNLQLEETLKTHNGDNLVLQKSNSDLRKQIKQLNCLIRDGRAEFQQKIEVLKKEIDQKK